MTVLTANQIEEQFAHLSLEDQKFLLDRLVQQRELNLVRHQGSRGPLSRALATGRELPPQTDFTETNSAGADLLSEAW